MHYVASELPVPLTFHKVLHRQINHGFDKDLSRNGVREKLSASLRQPKVSGYPGLKLSSVVETFGNAGLFPWQGKPLCLSG